MVLGLRCVRQALHDWTEVILPGVLNAVRNVRYVSSTQGALPLSLTHTQALPVERYEVWRGGSGDAFEVTLLCKHISHIYM